MRFPFVSRSVFEEVKRQRDELLRERNRLLDKLMQQSFGFQLHDSFAQDLPATQVGQVETEPEPAQETEEELQAREKAELVSRARTKPSTVPGLLERIMRDRIIRKAKAANPGPRSEVVARFEKLKSEVLKTKTIH